MNLEKIGKFIAECRKEKNLTQSQLAEKLNITDKAVSKWETGKGLPDVSIMIELCNILDINVNELLSGEKLSEENYHEKANENIMSMIKVADKNKKIKNKTILICTITIVIILMLRLAMGIFQIVEMGVEYDERIMKCEIVDGNIIYEINGLSVVTAEHEEVHTETETLVFFTNQMLLQNKIRSHWESWDSFAQLNNGKDTKFSAKFIIDIKRDIPECKENIKVYYTDISLKKIKNANQEVLEKIIQQSSLIAEQ